MAVAIATAPATSDLVCRYPKRKRAAVSYNETDAPDDDLFVSHDEDTDGDFGSRRIKKRKAAKREPRQKPFPLLSLPAELRNKIYQEVLGGIDGIYISNDRKGLRRSCVGTTDTKSWTRPGGNLLAASRAVYAEAAAVLYGQRFRFEDNRALLTFLSLLRPGTGAWLRDVTVANWNSGRTFSSMNVPAMTLLGHAAAGLCRLRVETELLRSRYYFYDRSCNQNRPFQALLARKVFRDCYPLLYAVQAQRGPAAALNVVYLDDANFVGQRVDNTQWGEPVDLQSRSHAEKVAARRRSYQKELGRLLGRDAAEVEALLGSSDAPVCA